MKSTLTLKELDHFCSELAPQLKLKTLLLIDGDLGSGKTYLCQALVKALGAEPAQSPSYALINSYPGGRLSPIYHVDLYRLETDEDLESTGFWDLFLEPALIMVEWASSISEDQWPMDWYCIRVQIGRDSASRSLRHYHWQGL